MTGAKELRLRPIVHLGEAALSQVLSYQEQALGAIRGDALVGELVPGAPWCVAVGEALVPCGSPRLKAQRRVLDNGTNGLGIACHEVRGIAFRVRPGAEVGVQFLPNVAMILRVLPELIEVFADGTWAGGGAPPIIEALARVKLLQEDAAKAWVEEMRPKKAVDCVRFVTQDVFNQHKLNTPTGWVDGYQWRLVTAKNSKLLPLLYVVVPEQRREALLPQLADLYADLVLGLY